VPARMIDKGIPTTGLLASAVVSKYAEHLPPKRQEQRFLRARAWRYCARRRVHGKASAASSCGHRSTHSIIHQETLPQQVAHVDETPAQMLGPGKGKTHQAYLWAYASTQFSELCTVEYDIADRRAGEYAPTFAGELAGASWCVSTSAVISPKEVRPKTWTTWR
jgi:transposase